ncbi:MAG: hypothetical protein WDO74_37185 [Pseudomonadota bacterium]
MNRFNRLAVLGPLALLALSAACTQMLDIQDARLDQSLTGGTSSANGGAGSLTDAGALSSGGTGVGGHTGGAGQQAGTDAIGASAGTDGVVAGAGGGDTPDQPSICETYCDAVLKSCKGKYEQYRTFDQCIEVCKRLPPGTPGDENVNSVECRIRQARFAESEAFLYCKSAGPLGAGKCGSNCVSYCSLMDATCSKSSTAGNIELSYFDNTQACLSNCAALPDDPTGPLQYSSSATSEPSTLVGNNIYCRTYHVTAGIEQDAPTEHCPHAMGGDPCIAQ